MKTLNKLIREIIEDEERFIDYLSEDMSEAEYAERISNLNEELNSCTTVEEIVGWYVGQGYRQNEAYQQVLKYLVEE